MMKNEVVPFGEYRGQPGGAMASERQYVDWLMQQTWVCERHKGLYTVIINNFQEPSETPEHNAAALGSRNVDAHQQHHAPASLIDDHPQCSQSNRAHCGGIVAFWEFTFTSLPSLNE